MRDPSLAENVGRILAVAAGFEFDSWPLSYIELPVRNDSEKSVFADDPDVERIPEMLTMQFGPQPAPPQRKDQFSITA